MDRQPLPELVYTHTHTEYTSSNEEQGHYHNFLYLFQNKEDEEWDSEEFESETVGLPIGYYTLLDLQTVGGIRQTNKKTKRMY